MTIRRDRARDLVASAEFFGLGWSCSHPCLVHQSAMLGEKSLHGFRRARYNTYCLLDDPNSLLV